MIKLTLAEIVEAIDGQPRGELPTASVRRVSTDSRTIDGDELFFAIAGPRFDGHAFVVDALRDGAVAAVIAADLTARRVYDSQARRREARASSSA